MEKIDNAVLLSKSQKKRMKKKQLKSNITSDKPSGITNIQCESLVHIPSVDICLPIEHKEADNTDQKVMADETEKSRQEVLAERAAKKQAKLAAKQGKPKPDATVKNEETGKKENAVPKKQTDKIAIEVIKKPNIVEQEKKLTPEEIKAQRENKKLLKQSLKVKDKPAVIAKAEMASIVKEEKTVNAVIEDGKSKAQLKAERRAKQEAQRAAKAQQKPTTQADNKAKTEIKTKKEGETKIKKDISVLAVSAQHRVKLFAHLYNNVQEMNKLGILSNIHPSIVQLRAQYSSQVVSGSNARCVALLHAIKQVVTDFETPSDKEFTRSLESTISNCMQFLSHSRSNSVSMVNSVKHLKAHINQMTDVVNENDCKHNIKGWIDTFIKEQLEKASEAICLSVQSKISDGDVILTYGCSSLVYQILTKVHNSGTRFRVIIVDGRPWLEGREMLRKLVCSKIECTYILVNALSFIMPEVTKVILGAHALLANGYVMSRVGSSQVALTSHAYNVPVLVCCETYKFCERVQTDSIVYNEIGNPEELCKEKSCSSRALCRWKAIKTLTPLNITYDVTPPDLVSAVITELAILPCTSVPVILRINTTETC